MIRAFKYVGSKIFFVNKFNRIERLIETSNKILIEPFVGSGSIFLNSIGKYKQYVINDTNENVIFYGMDSSN